MKKQALLVISFGTSFHDTYHKTIEAIEKDLQQAFPDADFFEAYTSRMIIKKLKQRDGIDVDTPAEALEKIKAAGYTNVLCQTTHIINGHEFYLTVKDLKPFQDDFDTFEIGRPLLTQHEDFEEITKILVDNLPPLSPVDAWVYMGHGTDHHANSGYPAMDHYLKEYSDKLYMATVEGYPTIDEVMKHLKVRRIKRVGLMPFMVVAGDHANNDMAGDDPDSWKSKLTAAGFDVTCVVKGLGEIPAVRQMFVEHAQHATPIKEII